MIERIIGHFNESARLKLDMAELLAPAIASAADHILQCILRDGKVPFSANGVGGTYMAQWRKVNGVWLVQAEVFVPTRCTGSKYCAAHP